jgi:hypothetical protein
MKNIQSIEPPTRFLRSTHLERDFYDPQALDSYVLTDVATDTIRRIAGGLRTDSSERCWRIIGDYGSGKSSFALLLAHWFAGNTRKFPKSLQDRLSYSALKLSNPKLVPILITGSREPLGTIIQRGIEDAVKHLYPTGQKKGFAKLAPLLAEETISDGDVLKLIKLVSDRIIDDGKGKGLLLIIDELGKVLEHTATSAGVSDVFLMQRLAEVSSRSGNKPLFVIGILHQGFSAYASSLGLAAKNEWDKVAGRFYEIVFQHPMEQTAALISEALNSPADLLSAKEVNAAKKAMGNAVNLGWYGAAASAPVLKELAPRLSPLDPFVVPVMSRVLNRFGQNQRSIFSFLFGTEPHALQSFLAEATGQQYRIHHFYDYIHSNLAHYLTSSFVTTNWTIIDSMVGSYVGDIKLHRDILKVVGVLNLIEGQDVTISPELVSLCLTGKANDPKVLNAIATLQSDTGKRVLFDRGTAGGLCLWPHISVDLQRVYERANSEIGAITNPADFIRTYLDNKKLVARRHYIKTGNLRYFSVVFSNVKDMVETAEKGTDSADGILLIPLCINQEEIRAAEEIASSKQLHNAQNCIVAIPGQLQTLTPFIREVQIWSWVSTNTPELNGDRFGRETVSRKKATAQLALEETINDVVGLDSYGESFPLKCYWKGTNLKVKDGRDLSVHLSEVCAAIFRKAPQVHHELLNRRNISSAAAAARMRLIERVLEHPNEPLLGMDPLKKPPEMSMYMSVLQYGGLHVANGNECKFVLPEGVHDKLKLNDSFSYLEDSINGNDEKPIKVSHLLAGLEDAPYGIRAGLAPVLLAVYYVANIRNIACYENGTFLSEVTGAEFLRLTKKPENFEFQYCNIDGLRTVAFERLAAVLKVKTDSAHPDLLDVVRPLIVIIAQLRPHAQKTSKLSSIALAVRNVLMDARDPITLLFELLPIACECDPIKPNNDLDDNADKFAKNLSTAIDELRGCYAVLQTRIKKSLMENFNFPKNKANKFREEIIARADLLAGFVSEARLMAFCFRLKDPMLSDNDWLDSVASMVAKKPPEKWLDSDEQVFNENLASLASRFIRTEGVAFDTKGNYASGSMRLCVTLPDGSEKKKVLTASDSDQKLISELENKFKKLIKDNGDLALIAASKAVWDNLKEEDINE